MKKLTCTLCAFALLLFMGVLPHQAKAQQSNDSRVLLQGFHWDSHDAQAGGWYNYVSSQASTIANAGIDVIWLPPPSDAGSDEGYLPRELNNLTNGYGIEADHLTMLTTLNNLGIEPVADIVVNHRVGSTNWLDFTNPTWGSWSITQDDEVFSQPEYSGFERGNWDTGTAYGPARDIDHTNTAVQNGIITWLNNLKTAGYKGWRYDFVHGFDPYYIKLYNDNSSPTFSVGEDWKGKQEIQDWIDDAQQSSSAFDFPTYYALKSAIKNSDYSTLAFYDSGSGSNQASGLIGWSPSKSVTFIENHDTPRYDPDNNILNGSNVGQAYAYLLTHPGVPTIYWPHYFDWGAQSELDQIIAVRKNNNITNTSSLTIIEDRSDVYAALVDNKVAVKLGYGNWSPAQAGWSDAGDYILQASGNNYAIWAKSTTPVNNPPVVTVTPAGPYTSSTAFDVTITATDDSGLTPTIYYTTNGDEPTTSNSYVSTTGFVTHNVTSTQTLKVMAIDNEGLASATQSHDYTIAQVSTFTVYFKKPSGWGAAMIHHWGAQPTGSLANSTWPGVTMQDASSEYGANWYKQTFSGISSTNLLFHSNGGSQTDDLSASATSWYDGGWVSEPTDNQAPTVSVSPAGGNFSSAVSVTITATDNTDPSPSISYTLNGTTSTASESVTLSISSASTLSVTATDASGNSSAAQSYNYTFNSSSNLVIHYRGSLSNPYLYYWGTTPNGGASSSWPGEAMTSEGNGWYRYEIPNADCSNIIFSNNGASQSADLNRCNEGWYDNGTWYDQEPSGGMTVHFKPNVYSNPTIYFWGVSETTSWPGEPMISEGDGWYYYTFTNDNCANIIFSNNGSSQTADLNRCGDGYYQNGSWSNSKSKDFGESLFGSDRTLELSINNFPNPFSISTTFEYQIPERTNVSLVVYNLMGKKVAELVNEEKLKGTYEVNFNRTDLKQGIYLYQLRTNHKKISGKMIIR